jgi:hypothetical protein
MIGTSQIFLLEDSFVGRSKKLEVFTDTKVFGIL